MRPLKSSVKTQPPFRKKTPFCVSVMLALMLAGTMNLNGCASRENIKNSQIPSKAESTAESAVTAEFIYKFLVGEVAGQRGDLMTSGSIFYDLAKSEKDPRLAERAAKIAAYAKLPGLAIPAVKLWFELDPSSTEAQESMTEMLIATGKLNEAEPYLAKLLSKEETRTSGFLYLNTLLARSSDKQAVLSLVQSLAKPYPKLAEAQFAIAQSAWTANQHDVALQALNTSELLKPNWNMAALLKGQVLFEKSPQAALDFYQDFLNKHPDANEIRINFAKLLVTQKQFDAAKREFPLILKYASDNKANNAPEISTIVGLLAYQTADYIAAESYFQQALTLGFKDADQIYIYLAQVSEKQSHDDVAVSWYNKVQSGQRYLEAQINLAHIIARTQSIDKAIEKLDAINDLNTEQQIIVIQTQAMLLAKAKRNQEAFDLLETTVKNLANTPELVYDYALAAERVQKFDIMESELRRVIAVKPDFAAAYNALGYSFADRNIKLNEAQLLIEKALSLSPNDHYMLDSLGWTYYRKGNLSKAIIYLQQAYKTSQDPEIAAHLGEVLWKNGQHDAAQKIWENALITNPDNEVLLVVMSKFKS
jgi:tetratricopeptide (TPR) repeat protein